jgi:hypothetical protein
MNEDELERVRRQMVKEVEEQKASDRADAERKYGKVWDIEELQRDYEVVGFLAPFVVVVRRRDGVKGSLMFQHSPRFYYGFQEDHR